MYKNIRQSNIELCRVVCMLLIIAHHSVVHGKAIEMNLCFNKFLSFFLVPGGKLCFVTFMVISTWFLVNQQFKLERFVKTWIQVFCYSTAFTVVAAILGTHLTKYDWFGVLFPILGNSHGFAATYLAFYLLIPFLAMVNMNIGKKYLFFLIFLLFNFQVVSRIMAVVINYHMPILSSELTLFILFYFISLWVKRYPINITNNKLIMFNMFFGVWVSVFGIWCLSITKFAQTKWYSILMSLANDESSILYILGGYALFFFFKNVEIKQNRIINFVAHASFGVLLFHDHNFFRYQLWKSILKASNWYYKKEFILWVLGCTIGIYMAGLIIETIRGNMEKHIFGLDKTKKTLKYCESYLFIPKQTKSN